MLLLQSLRDDFDVIARLFHSCSGFEARDGPQVPLVARRVVIIFPHGPVELALRQNQSWRQRMEVLAHHADDVVGATAELDGLAHDIRVAAEASLPQTIAKDDDEVFAVHLLFGGEDAAEQRLALHDFEEPVADLDRGNSFGFAIAGHDWKPTGVGRNVFKNIVLGTIVSYVSRGHLIVIPETRPSRRVAPQEHQRVWILVRNRAQQYRIDHAEDGGVRTDAQRNRQDRNGRERRALNQHPRAVTQVPPQIVHPGPPFVLMPLQIAVAVSFRFEISDLKSFIPERYQ